MRPALSRSIAVLLCAGGLGVSAGRGRAAADPAPRAAAVVFGFVWTARNEPIARAAVRLRNAISGRIEASTIADADGEFRFEDVEGGTYVLEYVDGGDRVLAVGHVFSIAPGETVATFIRLSRGRSGLAGWLFDGSNIAAAALASASGLGVTALVPPARDVTPER